METENCGALEIRRRLKNWSREEILEAYVEVWNKDKDGRNWVALHIALEREYERIRSILTSKYQLQKDLNRAQHMADLEKKVKKLKREVRVMQEAAERHNLEAYATGLIVNCTGCMPGKPFKGEKLTEERVREVEHIAKRLRTWWNNNRHRIKQSSD